MFSQKSMTSIDRELSKKVVKIIHGLLMMEQSAPFRKPVPHKALGLEDYKLIVKKPTDLNLIRRQNNEGKYKFVQQILDQIQLCWDNCKLYNAIDSEIYEQALHLEKAFDKFGMQILPDFWKSVNRQEYNLKFTERKIEDEKSKKPQPKGGKKQKVVHYDYPSEQLLAKPKSKKATFSNFRNVESEHNIEQQAAYKNDGKISPQNEENEGQVIENGGYLQAQHEKDSMQVEGGEEGGQPTVEPINVNLGQSPTRQQLLDLSSKTKVLYDNNEYELLEKILEVLHSNEKQNMALNKNGVMTFKMTKIHISTYLRIKKLLSPEQEIMPLIE